MNENEWFSGANPIDLLIALRGRGDDRKFRLLACACCRRIWNRIRHPRARAAVETAERFAAGQVTQQELAATRATIRKACEESHVQKCPFWAAHATTLEVPYDAAMSAVHETAESYRELGRDQQRHTEQAAQVRLIHDLFDDMWVSSDLANQARRWRTPQVTRIAQGIYDDRSFTLADLMSLADALRDAGCDARIILTHCERQGEHGRGCWVVDWARGV